jgi:hypothetical protein
LANIRNRAVASRYFRYKTRQALIEVDAARLKSIIKDTINKLNSLADVHASDLDEEDIDELAAVASEFDKSGDDLLKKQADVLDQVIINFGQISGTKAKEAQEKEIEKIERQRQQKIAVPWKFLQANYPHYMIYHRMLRKKGRGRV